MGALTAAQLSGFGVYLAATTALSAVSGALGFTLPFAAYTGLSQVVALTIGPVGWVVMGASALYLLGKPSTKDLTATELLHQ